jgi:MFS transporter, FSR family, fosmidomycin resistance protein
MERMDPRAVTEVASAAARGGARRARAALATVCSVHFVHDGFSDVLYVLLPIWAAEFRLGLAQVGLIRTFYTGGMAAFQIPGGLLAERWGEGHVLAAGTAVTAAGFVAAGWAGGFTALLAILLVAGLGSGVQHPLASSIVSRAYETGPRRAALGTYNFAGDLGKVAVPASLALAASVVGWRASAIAIGLLGLGIALILVPVLGRIEGSGPPPRAHGLTPVRGGWGIRDRRGFVALSAVGMIDNATRTGFLTLLPFVLIAKGVSVAGVGGALALLFAGGAAGKFVCGLAAERVGVIRTVVLTEAATAVGIVTIVAASQPVALCVLPLLGVALNGTSSVLYATVADLVAPDRRARSYGLYYSLSIGASSLAPTAYGALGDTLGAPATLIVAGLIVLVTIPLCLALRSAVTAPAV